MNTRFDNSTVRTTYAQEEANGDIVVGVANYDRVGTNDKAYVTLEGGGMQTTVETVFDAYLKPGPETVNGQPIDTWQVRIPRSSLPEQMRGKALTVRSMLTEYERQIAEGSVQPVVAAPATTQVSLPIPEAQFDGTSEFFNAGARSIETPFGQLRLDELYQNTSAQTYKNLSYVYFVKGARLVPSDVPPDVSSIQVEVTPLSAHHVKNDDGSIFVGYQNLWRDTAARLTLERQADGSFAARAPAERAFGRFQSVRGYYRSEDELFVGYAVKLRYGSGATAREVEVK